MILPVDSENTLHIMRRIPTCVEDDNSIGSGQIDTQSASPRGDQEQSGSGVVLSVETFTPG